MYLRQVESPRAIRHAMWTGRAILRKGRRLVPLSLRTSGSRGMPVPEGQRSSRMRQRWLLRSWTLRAASSQLSA